MRSRLFIDREEGTATILKTTGGNNPTKHGELTWKCESDADYDKVKSYYPNAEIVNI